MVKKRQKRLGTLPDTSKNKSSSDANIFRIRKCVVKIKRVKLPININTASKKADTPYSLRARKELCNDVNKTPFNAQSSIALNPCDATVFEPSRNSTMCLFKRPAVATTTPCKVRIRRIGTNPSAVTDLQIPGEKEKATSKREHRFFHRDQPPTRSRSSVTRNVYEFLSESQVDDNFSDQRKDPAADIIKQMIEDGRACAMTHKKGKTRARPVRKKVRPVGRRKKCSLRNKAVTDQAELPPYIERPLSPIYEPEPESDDGGNHADEALNIIVPVQVHPPQNMSPNPHNSMIEGSYSPLARSLLLNQTKTQNPQYSIERRRQLLNMARKFYSTPLNNKNTSARDNSMTFSSTLHQSDNRQIEPAAVVTSPSGGSSPWRVPDEVPMPNTFVFGLNTSQLPSYSSDYIRKRHVYVPDEPVPVTEPIQGNNESICPALEDQSIASAANDSNGENVPPPSESLCEPALEKTVLSLGGQENENEENFVQLPNPRRTLQQRTPLKDINILDVVILPSWKNNLPLPKTPIKENMARNHVHFDDSTENTIIRSPQQQKSKQPEKSHKSPQNYHYFEDSIQNSLNKSPQHQVRQKKSPGNLFGFEEFLTDDDMENSSRVPINQNTTLVEKLQRLKGLRPKEKELPQISKAAMRFDYDDLTAGTPKQRNIKEMLCSTMVATPLPTLDVNESTDLFKDLDPEVTFDEKKPRRTYVRERPKRKRKRVHVLFIDSDSSESDDNEQDKSDTSPGKAVPVKKRVRRDLVHEAKLQEYITSFNQECEEVEKFPLIVE